MSSSRGVFYGWWVTLAFSVMVFVSAGVRHAVGPFLYGGRALIFAGLFLIRDNPAAMLAVAMVGGMTLAGSMSMTSVLTADIYGRYSVGRILGVIFLVHQTGAALGSWLAGAL